MENTDVCLLVYSNLKGKKESGFMFNDCSKISIIPCTKLKKVVEERKLKLITLSIYSKQRKEIDVLSVKGCLRFNYCPYCGSSIKIEEGF